MQIDELCKHYTVDLIVVCPEGGDFSELPYYRRICRRVHVRTISRLECALNILKNLHLPLTVRVRASSVIRREVAAAAPSKYDVAVFEWSEAAVFMDDVVARSKQVVCQDVMSKLYVRRAAGGGLKGGYWKFEKSRAIDFESHSLKKADKIFAHSLLDAADIAAFGISRARIKVVAPEFYRVPNRIHAVREPARLLFWGSFSRAENREAAQILVDEILPKLSFGRFEVVLAGAHSEKYFSARGGVRVVGFVENPEDAFREADIAVLPLRHGAGLKVKVLESLYAGLPVVTTDVGTEGFSASREDGLYEATTIAQFVEEIELLTSDPVLYARASKSAADWARAYEANSDFQIV
jgi:glycosyltransferase involved in cell wall biosynthesis